MSSLLITDPPYRSSQTVWDLIDNLIPRLWYAKCLLNGISKTISDFYLCKIIYKEMIHYFIIPGYGGSGVNHWQTWFEQSGVNFHRIVQKDWNNPDINDWISTLDNAITKYEPESVVLVAHSLGCLTVAEWAKRYNRNIKAALLVAPPDTDLLHYKLQKELFPEVPLSKLNFPSRLVASTNDPWAKIEQAEFYAQSWGSEFINIGRAGHINDISGHYEWREGLEILYSLADEISYSG